MSWRATNADSSRPASTVLRIIDSLSVLSPRDIRQQEILLSQIVEHSLRKDLLTGFESMVSLKLLVYELIMSLTEDKARQSSRRKQKCYHRKENSLPECLKSISNNLKALQQSEMLCRTPYFQQLLAEWAWLQVHIAQTQGAQMRSPIRQDDRLNGQLALQLETVIAKKEQRIHQLTQEMKVNIKQQQQMELFFQKICSENQALEEQIHNLQTNVHQPQNMHIYATCSITVLPENSYSRNFNPENIFLNFKHLQFPSIDKRNCKTRRGSSSHSCKQKTDLNLSKNTCGITINKFDDQNDSQSRKIIEHAGTIYHILLTQAVALESVINV